MGMSSCRRPSVTLPRARATCQGRTLSMPLVASSSMFHALIESGPRDSIRAQRYVVSVGVHGLAIVAAAMLTRASTGSVRPKPVPIAHPFVLPPAVPAVPAPSRPFPLPRRSNDWQPVVDGPPPALPPVSLGEGLPTVGDLLQRGDFGHGNLGFIAGDSAGAVLPATEVDDPVAVIRQPLHATRRSWRRRECGVRSGSLMSWTPRDASSPARSAPSRARIRRSTRPRGRPCWKAGSSPRSCGGARSVSSSPRRSASTCAGSYDKVSASAGLPG
jgi:hypothetical protein